MPWFMERLMPWFDGALGVALMPFLMPCSMSFLMPCSAECFDAMQCWGSEGDVVGERRG